MKAIDVFLQKYRIKKALSFIQNGSSILDIGCYDGMLFLMLKNKICRGVGVDPLDAPWLCGNDFLKITGKFPDDLSLDEKFDVITMIASVEHISSDRLSALPEQCADYLKPDGLVVMTIPSPIVDSIIEFLVWIKIADGMSLEEHYGVTPKVIHSTFCRKHFHLETKKPFQFGLNQLFVFKKK
jgi:cyclopropane fatty-acyl-phospholipid synthase-like methyltransferase